MKTDFPDPADLLNFKLTITPDEGLLDSLQLVSLSHTSELRHVPWRGFQVLFRDKQ